MSRSEQLEPRRLLAVSINSGLLVITGESSNQQPLADVVTVSLKRHAYTVVQNGVATIFPSPSIQAIRIDTGGGNDLVKVSALVSVTLLSGAGNDSLTAGDANDILSGGDGNDPLVG